MDFSVAVSKRPKNVAQNGCKLTFYQEAPHAEVSLENFEIYAMDRLRVLKGIEEAKSRGKRVDELDGLVQNLWRKNMRANVSDPELKDAISHFVLRLVYCRSEDLRRWFLAMESSLFRHRFRAETPASQKLFLEQSNLPYKAITSAEFEAVRNKLATTARSTYQPVPNVDSVFYKVQFEEVPELVANRKVFIKKGFAYVPRDHLAVIVVGQFRSRLSKSLVLTNRKWTATIKEDEKDRLTPIVEALSNRYLGADYSQPKSKDEISLQDLDAVAQTSFPLCMRHLYFKVKEDHHLRHGGRQQLGLFLKGAGLRLEDALAFWRREFSQKVGGERFDKEYAYNVRHNYGKEGKRTDYTPYSCMKLIMSTPGVGDQHGCPYRHFSEENLRAALGGMKLNHQTTNDVMDKVRSRHYQLACAATFDGSHGCACDGINHPNQYFEQSQKLLRPKAAESSGVGSSVPGQS